MAGPKKAYLLLVDFTCLAYLFDFENPYDLTLYIVTLVINNKSYSSEFISVSSYSLNHDSSLISS